MFDGVVAVAGADSVATFNSKTGAPIGTFDAPNLLRGQPLVDATPAPFAVSILAITRDGRAIGLRPAEMMFRERAVEPLTALPGRPLQKEAEPADPERASAGCSVAARRRTPSRIRSGVGAENDRRIVL